MQLPYLAERDLQDDEGKTCSKHVGRSLTLSSPEIGSIIIILHLMSYEKPRSSYCGEGGGGGGMLYFWWGYRGDVKIDHSLEWKGKPSFSSISYPVLVLSLTERAVGRPGSFPAYTTIFSIYNTSE